MKRRLIVPAGRLQMRRAGGVPTAGRRPGRGALTLCLLLAAAVWAPQAALAQVLFPLPAQGLPGSNPQEPASAPGSSTGQATQGEATTSPFTPVQPTTSPAGPTQVQDATAPATTATTAATAATGATAPAQGTTPGVNTVAQLALVPPRPKAQPGEFEKFVATTLGRTIPRFGASLMDQPPTAFATPATTTVPDDYELNPGDEIIVRLTGSIEGETHLVIDSNGRVFLPHVGSIDVVGVRYGDLQALLKRRVGEQYRNFKVSVAIGRLHGITVYVTGYAVSPGAYTVSSLSTLVDAVMASGGPSASGSFRSILLRRNGQVVTDFDFYDLLLQGDKTHDSTLQNEDVIYIAPVGHQAAITGSVNQEAIYEARPGETLGDLLADAGGLSTLAEDDRLFISRLSDLDKNGEQELALPAALALPVERGDLVRVVSVADYARPLERQAIVVKIEGEVDHPGRYYLAPNSSLGDLLARAGGLTSHAFVYGAELDRVTVRRQQRAAFDQAVDNLELTVAAAPLGRDPLVGDDLGAQAARAQLARQVIEQLRGNEPSGRLVLALTPQSTQLPADMTLENDDRIYIPPPPTTVGVFGAVYQPGSFSADAPRRLGDYLRMAGGPEKIADRSDIFVVHANGAVVAKNQFGWGSSFESQPAEPGDVIFVPIKTQPNLWWERLVQATSIFYNIGLGAAAIKVLSQ